MTKILKEPKFIEDDGMTNVNVRSARIQSQLYPQWLASCVTTFKLCQQFIFRKQINNIVFD